MALKPCFQKATYVRSKGASKAGFDSICMKHIACERALVELVPSLQSFTVAYRLRSCMVCSTWMEMATSLPTSS